MRVCIWYTDLYNTHDLKKDIIQKCFSDMRKWEIEEEERIRYMILSRMYWFSESEYRSIWYKYCIVTYYSMVKNVLKNLVQG